MKWRSASSAGQFRLLNQTLTLDQVAEFRRTRRVKEGTGSSASVSAAFGPVGPIHPGNPGSHGLLHPAEYCLDVAEPPPCARSRVTRGRILASARFPSPTASSRTYQVGQAAGNQEFRR